MGFLTNLKLTLGQYLTLTLAALAGILAILLKVRGDQLRSAKVDLLKKAHEVETEKTDAKVVAAMDKAERSRARLSDALADYNRSVPAFKRRNL